MTVTVELTVNGSADPVGRYLTWTPYPAQLRLVAPDAATGPVTVLLRNASGNVGRLAFRAAPTEDGEPETTLQLPVDGSPVDVLLSGEFMAPSVEDGDAVLEAVVDGEVVAQVPFMVRVRKDAETLTDRRARPVRQRLRLAQQPRARHLPRLPRDAHRGHQRRGPRARRVPAVAPGVPARPRAGAAGDRPVGRAALLALRRARAAAVLRRLRRRPGRRPLVVRRPAAGAVRGQPAAVLDHRRRPVGRPAPEVRRPADSARRRRNGAAPSSTSARCCCSRPRRTLRTRTWTTWTSDRASATSSRATRTAPPTSASPATSAPPAPPPATRCSSCSTATSTGSGRSGSGTRSGSTARRSRRTSTAAAPATPCRPGWATTCTTRCGRGTA